MSSLNTTYGVGGADVEAASAGDEVALLQEPQRILESLLTHPGKSKNKPIFKDMSKNAIVIFHNQKQLLYCVLDETDENLLLLSFPG